MSCGLSIEQVTRFHENKMCLVIDGVCQNPRKGGNGKCLEPIGDHPSEKQTQGKYHNFTP